MPTSKSLRGESTFNPSSAALLTGTTPLPTLVPGPAHPQTPPAPTIPPSLPPSHPQTPPPLSTFTGPPPPAAVYKSSDSSPWYKPSPVNKSGLTIFYDGRQPGANRRFWRGYPGWERKTFRVFKRFVPGKIVLDIGAWIGPTCIWEAQLATMVVALEPTKSSFRQLAANINANPSVNNKLVALNAAMDVQDGKVMISNRGNSMDRIGVSGPRSIETVAVSISSLRGWYPQLEQTGFVKIDTEGYERVLVPALEDFFREKRPVVYVSLHPMFISHAHVQSTVDKLADIFPHLYEADMVTPFNTKRNAYTRGDHGGADVLCVWQPL